MKRIDRYDLILGRPNPVEGRASWHIGLTPLESEHGPWWLCPTCGDAIANDKLDTDRVRAKLRGHWLRTHR